VALPSTRARQNKTKFERENDALLTTADPVGEVYAGIEEFNDQITGRRSKESKERAIPFLEWAQNVPEPKTGPLNFTQFPFQPDMYRVFGSDLRDVVVRKCTQVGISALTVRWGLYQADKSGHTVLYVFPTEGDVYDFSDARVDPMVDGSEYLDARRSQPWNKGLKRIGRGLVYFRGSENKRGLDSVDADALALDEYDTLNQTNIPDAERRLSGVMSAGLIRRVGVPSLPEYGIAQRYDESDRRKWLVRCPSCDETGEDQETKKLLLVPDDAGGWQEISFWKNVDKEHYTIVCQWCREPLDVGTGQWVAQQPDGDLPGFHVSRLIVPGMPLKGIVKSSEASNPFDVEVFYNKDLGLPYVAKESRLAPDDLYAAQSAAASAIGAYELPSGYDGFNFAARFPGRVYLVSYGDQMREAITVKDETWDITVERTVAIDAMVEQIRRQHNYLPATLPAGYVQQMTAIIRRTHILDETTGKKRVVWESTRADDYAHAETYDVVATELYWRRMGIDEQTRQTMQPLEQLMPFRRTTVNDLDDIEYRGGPADREVDPFYVGG
jgi:hypothetical protein